MSKEAAVPTVIERPAQFDRLSGSHRRPYRQMSPLTFITVSLWVAGAALALAAPETLDRAWEWVRDQPPAAQIVGAVVLLPYLLAYLAWTAPWDLWLRLVSVVVVAGLTIAIATPSSSRQ
jgi:hypothetical protein